MGSGTDQASRTVRPEGGKRTFGELAPFGLSQPSICQLDRDDAS
jgi:hypothetical protein